MKTAKKNDSACLFCESIPEVKAPRVIEVGNQIASTCFKKHCYYHREIGDAARL